ncbi:type III-B CRISPR-associated protein Cas10/Cmr2 [Nocardiopsis alba]|uniref:type III-B CRISPR-associated protein Cas10/Cmr2 n=1 Tax=Nocardiopsis alba TaxID=53437 RepID=UPI00364255DA
MSAPRPGDLVAISLSGVQVFITESRTTADAANASDIVGRLASLVAARFTDEELVIPYRARVAAAPNRIVALVEPGTGAERASGAVAAARQTWQSWVERLFSSARETPGFPDLMWAVAPASGDYTAQWEQVHTALSARKRLRGFDFPEAVDVGPCSLAPRWAAERRAPQGVPAHEQDQALSAAGWVKRRWHAHPALPSSSTTGFASTSSIASTPYRIGVLRAWDLPDVRQNAVALHDAVRAVMGPGRFRFREAPVPAVQLHRRDAEIARWWEDGAGPWVWPEAWQEERLTREYGVGGHRVDPAAVRRGRAAATALRESLEVEPNPYYAVLVADLDSLGKVLSAAPVDPTRHRALSQRLGELARKQRREVEEGQGVAVYAGGDDLLAFTPASTALEIAAACRDQAGADPTTLSCAVLFVHHIGSLRQAILQAQELLAAAKSTPGKNAVAVGYLTGSGSRATTVRPWEAHPVGDALQALRTFRPVDALHTAGGLSPRLLNDLYRERWALADLASIDRGRVYAKEVARLVVRHGGTEEDARILVGLGACEHAKPEWDPVPLEAAKVAVFLRRQTW